MKRPPFLTAAFEPERPLDDPLELLDALEWDLRRVDSWTELEDWLNTWPQPMSKDVAGQFSLDVKCHHAEDWGNNQLMVITRVIYREGFCPPDQLEARMSIDMDHFNYNRMSSASDMKKELVSHAERRLFSMFKERFLDIATERLTP